MVSFQTGPHCFHWNDNCSVGALCSVNPDTLRCTFYLFGLTDAFFIDTCCWVCVVVFYISVMKSLSTIVLRNWTKRKHTWNVYIFCMTVWLNVYDCYGQFGSSLNRSSDRQRLLQGLTEDELSMNPELLLVPKPLLQIITGSIPVFHF